MSKLKVWHNGCDYVIAENLDEAKMFLHKLTGLDDEDMEGDGWQPYDDSDEISYTEDENQTTTKLTAEAWCRKIGKGYFASNEW